MTIANRLKTALQLRNMTQCELSNKSKHINQQMLSKICNNIQSDITTVKLKHICDGLGINAIWLAFGEGEMLSDNNEKYFTISMMEESASMGDLVRQNEQFMSKAVFKLDWIKINYSHASNIDNLRLITAYGESMEGTYNDGDFLVVDIGKTNVSIDGIYAFKYKEGLYIKKISREGDELSIISTHKDYPKWKISTPCAGLEIIGRILGSFNHVKY